MSIDRGPGPAGGRLDRRTLLRYLALGGAAAATAPLLGACATEPSVDDAAAGTEPGDARLRVGYLPITDATPLLIAHANGYYADEGLEVERPTLLRSWPAVAEAFQARQVDIVHLLMPMAIQLRFEQSFPLKLVAWNHTDGSALTVANDIDGVSDLAGRTVAVPFWYSIHNVALQMLLAEAGLTPVLRGDAADDEVKLVVMPPPDMPPALANDSIAGYIVADPFNAAAEVNGIGRIARFTGDVWLRHACCVSVMHEDALAERPEWAQATLNGLVRAQRFAREERAETARLLSREGEGYLPQPLEAVDRALTHYDEAEYTATDAITHPDWGAHRIDFQPFPFPSYTEELIRHLRETEVEGDDSFLDELEPLAAHDELVDDGPVRRAIDTIGGPETFGLDPSLTRSETIDV